MLNGFTFFFLAKMRNRLVVCGFLKVYLELLIFQAEVAGY